MTQGGFGDIPLFREIQRLLAAGDGPVNYEIAGQVAGAIASGAPEAPVGSEDTRRFSEAVRGAEMMLAGYSRIVPESPLRTQVVNPTWWATSTLETWRWLFDHLAEKFSEQLPGAEGGSGDMFQQAMGQIGPLMMGLQAGTLTGHLAREVVTRFEIPVPRDDDGKLFYVAGNAATITSAYSFDHSTFVRWLALQEAARGLIVGHVPWLEKYWRGLLTELVDSIEIDVGGIQQQLDELSSGGMESLTEGIGSAGGIVPVVETERHRAALARVQALVTVFEGYARHTAGAVVDDLIGDVTIIEEGMSRRNLEGSEGKNMLASMLGLSLDRKLENSGVTFCAAVAQLNGVPALNKIWTAPDNLPSLDEIKDPFAWMERAHGE